MIVLIGAFAIAAAQPPAGYVWHTAMANESVQYGRPGTDDRALRIDCREGQITIAGPAGLEVDEGAAIGVSFRTSAGEENRRAEAVYMGDGTNFVAPVAADDPALAALMRGEPLRISVGDDWWEVPGEGAAAVLRPLLQGCGR
jgi:hypothetical protein